MGKSKHANKRQKNFTPLKSCPRSADIPASEFQESSFLLSKLNRKADTSQNVVILFRVESCKCADTLKLAIQACLSRHEIFRTYFEVKNDEILQRHTPKEVFDLSIPIIDLSGLTQEQAERETQKKFKEEQSTPFDLEKPNLFRVHIFKKPNDEVVLLQNFHHSIFDGSTSLILRLEIAQNYYNLLNGRLNLENEPELHFSDYSYWEKSSSSSLSHKQQTKFWEKELMGAPEQFNLPVDHFKNEDLHIRAALVSHQFDSSQWSKTKSLSKKMDVSNGLLCMSVYAIFLTLISNDRRICLSLPIDLRRKLGLEDMVGPLVNEFIIRYELSDEDCLENLLVDASCRFKKCVVNSDLFFERAYTLSGNLIEPMPYVYLYPRLVSPITKGISFFTLNQETGGGECNLIGQLSDYEETAQVSLRFDNNLIKESTASLMMDLYVQLHESLITKYQSPISTILNNFKGHRFFSLDLKPISNKGPTATGRSINIKRDALTILQEATGLSNLKDIGRLSDLFLSAEQVRLIRKKTFENCRVDLTFNEILDHNSIEDFAELIRKKSRAKYAA